ncbi:MAG TPA: hypothetical protein P5032_16870, partial [Candidatus Competibacter sp.]|nr:hypothetical protein [Candidatus Competibacter sp.]
QPLGLAGTTPAVFSRHEGLERPRSAPDLFELANFRSSIWEALKGIKIGSVVGGTLRLGR